MTDAKGVICLKNVDLKKVEHSAGFYKVFMVCDVGTDTNEGGIIYIDKDYRFSKFGASW